MGILLAAGLAACARPRAGSGAGSDTLPATVTVDVGGWTRGQRDSASAAMERQRAKWSAQRPASYRYAIAGSCFCAMTDLPQEVTVRAGVAVARPDTSGGAAAGTPRKGGPGRAPYGADGIDALFDSLAVAVRDTAIDAVLVDYDARWGFPERITLDRLARAVDDEFHIQVSRFEALP